MTDELDLLSSLNPVPEVRGNPGPVPVPSPGDLLAETGMGSGEVTATPSSRGRARPRRSGDGGRPGRSRLTLGVVGVAATVAVVVGIVALTGDDARRRDQVITSVDESPPEPDDSPVVEPDEPRFAEEAAPTTDPAAAPAEDLVVTDETIPWPDPIVIEVTPENAGADRIIEVPAGVVVLEIRGAGWELSANHVTACEAYETVEANGYSCQRRVRTPLLDDRSFARRLVIPGMQSPTTLLVQFNDPSGAGPLAVGTLVPDGGGFPTLTEPDVRSVSWGQGVVDRVTLEARVAAAGWDPEQPIVFHVCASRPVGSIDAGDCAAVASSAPTEDGTAEASLTLPIELVGGAVEGSEFWLVGAQGSRLAAMRYTVLGPRVDPGPRPDSLPTTVDVPIIDLRAGERAVVKACGGSASCREPIRSVEVVSSGSGLDTLRVTVDENVDRLQVLVEGSIVADGIWFESD